MTFPSLHPPAPSLWVPPPSWTDASAPGVAAHFIALKKPSDVNLDTLALLNVSFEPECTFETLLASISNDAQSHLPPTSWLQEAEHDHADSTSTEPKKLCNGKKCPDRNDFYLRAKEISFKNQDAFANLTRRPMGEKVPLRLAHFRKFWEGLDNMAYYWDNSLDQYLIPTADNGHDKSTSRVEAATGSSPLSTTFPSEEEPRKKAKTEPPANTSALKAPWEANAATLSEKSIDLSKGSYKGYRIGNGAEMPDSYRLETVRAFLEPIAWAFGVTLVPHRRPPVLQLEHIRFPVRMSTVAWRGPQDRIKARQGWMEGPVLGVQCRADTNFASTGDLQTNSVLDTVRELGGMLLLAQERAREAKSERRAGEGKWWTTTHRWGGGPGGEVGEGQGASDAPSTDSGGKSEDKPTSRSRVGSKDRRKPTPAEIWKTLKPGNPLWDPKVVYEAIGKDKSVAWDDVSHKLTLSGPNLTKAQVFMVSSLNHHISILKLRVHPLYLQYLTEGILPESAPEDGDWCSPKLQRTRWFDLFDVNDRNEAMRGLWGVLDYLMRAQQDSDVTMEGS